MILNYGTAKMSNAMAAPALSRPTTLSDKTFASWSYRRRKQASLCDFKSAVRSKLHVPS